MKIDKLNSIYIYITIAMFYSVFTTVLGARNVKILVATLILIEFGLTARKTRFCFPKNAAFLYIIYSFYIIINGFYFENPERFQSAIFYYIIYPLLSVVLMNKSQLNLEKICKYTIVCTIPNVFVGLYEFVTQRNLFSSSVLKIGIDGNIRPAGLTGSFISLPLALGVGGLICFYFYYESKRSVYLLGFILESIAIFFSMSRGPLVGYCIGLVILYISLAKEQSQRKKVIAVSLIILLLGILTAIVFSGITFSNDFVNRVLIRVRQIFVWDGSNGDASNVTRSNRWFYYLKLFSKKPVFGYGIGSTGSAIANYQKTTMGVTESSIIKRLVETGMVGTVLFYTYLIVIAKSIVPSRNKKNMLSALFLSIIVMFISEHVVLQINEMLVPSILWWIFIGLIRWEASTKNILDV